MRQMYHVFFLHRNVSETTLEQVNEIERKIKEARERREEARKLQNSTDEMVAEINQITKEVWLAQPFIVSGIVLVD